ncbi:MAG: hypothetical protein ACLR13_09780 [Acutalibacteraceae bacterium]
MRALSVVDNPKPHAQFDERRSGFIMGECGRACLEELEHAVTWCTYLCGMWMALLVMLITLRHLNGSGRRCITITEPE